jgi:hypothetical protein
LAELTTNRDLVIYGGVYEMTSDPSNTNRASYPAGRQWRLPLLVSVVFLVCCVWVNGKKPFWADELTCVYLIQDHSFGHVLHALAGGADVAPPLYYVSAWSWARVAGVSQLSLRLHSWLWISVAFALTWTVLRRRYGYWPASVGCATAFCLSRLVLYHNSETRFYAFFLGVVAFGVWVFDRVHESNRLRPGQMALIAVAHASMVYAHVFGVLYSGCILLAWIMADAWQRRWRPAVYASVVIGWLIFLPWLPIFHRQTAVFQHASWIPIPTVTDLLEAFALKINLPLALIFISGFALLNQRQRVGRTLRPQTSAQEALFLLSVIFIVLVPLALWIFSQVSRSVFWDRYMIASTLGWAIILSFLCEELGLGATEDGGSGAGSESGGRFERGQFSPWLLLGLILAFPLFHALLHPRIPRPNAERLPASLAGLPIALQTPHAFLPRMYYLGTNNNYYYVLDWEASSDPHSKPGASINDQTVDGLRRFYSLSHVVNSPDFLSQHQRFLYFDQHVNAWFDLRVRQSGQYKLTLIPRDTPGMFLVDGDGTDVWLAERIGDAKAN